MSQLRNFLDKLGHCVRGRSAPGCVWYLSKHNFYNTAPWTQNTVQMMFSVHRENLFTVLVICLLLLTDFCIYTTFLTVGFSSYQPLQLQLIVSPYSLYIPRLNPAILQGCCLCLITKLESNNSQEMLDSDLAENGPHNILPGVCTTKEGSRGSLNS